MLSAGRVEKCFPYLFTPCKRRGRSSPFEYPWQIVNYRLAAAIPPSQRMWCVHVEVLCHAAYRVCIGTVFTVGAMYGTLLQGGWSASGFSVERFFTAFPQCLYVKHVFWRDETHVLTSVPKVSKVNTLQACARGLKVSKTSGLLEKVSTTALYCTVLH